jgi:hypothetical protein
VEDLTYANRTVAMFEKVLPSYRRIEQTLEANWQEPIAAGASRRMVHPLPIGILNQSKYLWLKVCPLQFEIELVGAYADCLAGNAQTPWEISDVRLLADACHVTAEFSDNISRSLLQGVPLPLHVVTYAVNKIGFSLANQSQFTVNINRALTRLKSLWWTMEGNLPDTRKDATSTVDLLHPFELDALINETHNPAGGVPDTQSFKGCNLFYHPYRGTVPNGIGAALDSFEWQIQVGGSFYPAQPVRGIAESAWMLHKTCGLCWQGMTDIPRGEFCHTAFIGAYSFEKAINCAGSGSGFSGESTVAGQQVSIIVKGLVEANAPTSVTVVLCHDLIMNIRQEGVEVLI